MTTGVRRYLSAEEQRTLAVKAQQGDEHAFGTLYEHFSDAVTGYAAARVRSAEDAIDVASETFTAALSLVRDGRYDPQYAFYTFLRLIADSQIAHYLRKTHVTVPSPSDSGATQHLRRLRPLAEIPEIACLPDQELETCASELLLVVLSCGSKPHQALTFCLVGVLDWRPREVIEQLGSQSLFALARRVYDDFAGHSSRPARGRPLCRDHCPQFWHLLVSPVRDVYPEQEYQGLRTHVGPVGDLP
ncbi:MAG: sigma-70 family RNA polymerase sigma factor, partial [Candidatus Eisenbacteria bacterium]|nr:sigma-70 family RNA polymerase sigma factor [Candidatus Eisenbacteria bacterium]